MKKRIIDLFRETKEHLRTRLSDKAVLTVFAIVAVWNVMLSFDWGKEHFPIALQTQLHFYKFLWSWRQTPQYNSTVSLVRIDDSLHWGQSACDSPTSRHLLAQLIGNASKLPHKAAVIALDVQLFAPVGKAAGWHNPGSELQDDELLGAIRDAAKVGVSVIVPVGFVPDTNGGWIRIPNIYRDEELPLPDDRGNCGYPACAALGSIKLPKDKREIPLQDVARDWYTGSKLKRFQSFALAAADAKSRTHVPPTTRPPIMKALSNSEPLFGGFLPGKEFTAHEISAQELADGKESAMRKCDGNLVLIRRRMAFKSRVWPAGGLTS
jgi:hypothetical protein